MTTQSCTEKGVKLVLDPRGSEQSAEPQISPSSVLGEEQHTCYNRHCGRNRRRLCWNSPHRAFSALFFSMRQILERKTRGLANGLHQAPGECLTHPLPQPTFIWKKKNKTLLGKSNATVFNTRRKEDIYASLVLKTKTPPSTARLKQQC